MTPVYDAAYLSLAVILVVKTAVGGFGVRDFWRLRMPLAAGALTVAAVTAFVLAVGLVTVVLDPVFPPRLWWWPWVVAHVVAWGVFMFAVGRLTQPLADAVSKKGRDA